MNDRTSSNSIIWKICLFIPDPCNIGVGRRSLPWPVLWPSVNCIGLQQTAAACLPLNISQSECYVVNQEGLGSAGVGGSCGCYAIRWTVDCKMHIGLMPNEFCFAHVLKNCCIYHLFIILLRSI